MTTKLAKGRPATEPAPEEYGQVANAIRKRGRASGVLQGSMRCCAEAVTEDGRDKFAILA